MAFYISRFKKRKEITFDVEVITPMFLGGADQEKAELRASSIKGLMRFWWRAIRADADLKTMRDKESSIFGGTGDDHGKSSFSILLHDTTNQRIGNDFREELREEDGRRRIAHPQNRGLGYLFYSTYTLKDRGALIKRPYIRPQTKFKLTFSAGEQDVLDHVIPSFWLLVHLGGLGTRGRRGGGCLRVTHVSCSAPRAGALEKRFIPDGDLSEFLVDGYKWAREKIAREGQYKANNEFSTLAGSSFLLNPASQYSDWKSALNEIGLQYRKYRLSVKHKLFIGPNFGFPVMHDHFKTRMVGKRKKETLERRSSPLIIKTVRANGVYYPLVILLSGTLLPPGGRIVKQVKRNRQWVDSGQPVGANRGHINAFLVILTQHGYVHRHF